MYIIFRADLPEMTRAKGEIEAAHAAASMIYRGMLEFPSRIKNYMGVVGKFGEGWEKVTEGQAKVNMEVENEAALY